MENLMTITEITKMFGISTRTLRYYEQIGLLNSQRMAGYAYRVYDEKSCTRLQQIIILHKLHIPLKQIAVLLNDADIVNAIEIFMENVEEMNTEISSLTAIRNILEKFVEKLQTKVKINLQSELFRNELFSIVLPIAAAKSNVKETVTMEQLDKTSVQINQLKDRDVRIIYLPPARVASYRCIGDDPEMHANEVVDQFVRDMDLIHKKPDLRHYGFNAPNPDETGYHGYEVWITVPEDLIIPEPLQEKHFEGGLYAAHMIPFGAFEEWEPFNEWLTSSKVYEYRGDWSMSNMFGWLDEHLNYVNHVMLPNTEPEGLQLDLLIPIKEKN